ncbi:MAG: hypothetical protein ACU0CA_07350, partial [Paracoccaceae bacterium]
INNSMIQVYFGGLAKLMPLAKRAAPSLETALRILSGGLARMPMFAARILKVLGEDKSVGFAINAVSKGNDVFQRVLETFDLDSSMLAIVALQRSAVEEAGLLERDPAELVSLACYYGANSPLENRWTFFLATSAKSALLRLVDKKLQRVARLVIWQATLRYSKKIERRLRAESVLVPWGVVPIRDTNSG